MEAQEVLTGGLCERSEAPSACRSLEALRSGGREAQEVFVDRYYTALFRWLHWLTGDRDRAADLTQETFATFWRCLHSADPSAEAHVWLFAVGRNVWLQSCPAADVPEGLRARCLATIPESQQTEDAVRAAPTVEAPASPAATPDTVRLHERKRTMFRIARYSSIAAAAVVVSVVAGYSLPVHPTASVTFAQVIENVTKAESISFVFRQKIGSQPVMVSRMYMQRDRLRMDLVGAEITADLAGSQAEGAKKLKELREGGNLPVLLTLIGDTSRKDAIELDHFRKTAVKSKRMYIRAEAGIPQNLVEQFRNVKGEDAELVGEHQRDGRKVLAYRLTKLDLPSFMARKEPGDQMEMTVWADAKTGLPVRIRVEGALSATRDDHSFFDWDEFAWNQPLDPGLFSLEVPEGYAVKEPPPAPAREETAKPGSKEMIKREIEKMRAAREAAIEREGKAPQE